MASPIQPLLEQLVRELRSLNESVKLLTSTIIENQRINRELVDVLKDQRDELELLRAQPARDARLRALADSIPRPRARARRG